MSEERFQSGSPKGTQEYDTSLLNAALAEKAAQRDVSSQESFSGAPSYDMQCTEDSETERMSEPEMSFSQRENAELVTSNEPVDTAVAQQCLSPSNPFAADLTEMGGEVETGNPQITDPANPFYDAVHSGEDKEVDRNVVTGRPVARCMSVYMSVCLSVCLYVCLFVCLSVY